MAEPIYAFLYNKTPADKEYLPGDVVSAETLDCRYSSFYTSSPNQEKTYTAQYNDDVVVDGDWEICGYLARGGNCVCLYVKVT